jgi:peptide/nickel transport system permease protein
MPAHVTSNLVVAVLLLGIALAVRFVRRNGVWRDAARQLWRRRPLAICVVALYGAIALLDSVAWTGGAAATANAIEKSEARTVLSRLLPEHKERSYSAPFASSEFYGNAPLAHPRTHVLGTDILGRDVFRLTLRGAKVALLVGGLTSLIAIPLALFFGVSAGYFGKRLDDVVFFIMSTLASMPGLLLLIALIMVLGQGTVPVCVALAVTSWVGFCRLARGETLKLREMDYVHAARIMGVSEVKIILRHIVPNLLHLVVITFVLMFSGLVLSEAVLSWLGIGVDGSWGQMIAQAKDELSRDPVIWWNITAAGMALFGLLLAMNFVGDAVRDILDPRTFRESP